MCMSRAHSSISAEKIKLISGWYGKYSTRLLLHYRHRKHGTANCCAVGKTKQWLLGQVQLQDTISDKRGIQNTRTTQSLVGRSGKMHIRCSKAFCLLTELRLDKSYHQIAKDMISLSEKNSRQRMRVWPIFPDLPTDGGVVRLHVHTNYSTGTLLSI